MIYLNGTPLVSPTLTMFPDNTSQVWKLPEEILTPKHRQVDIEWNFSSEGEFMHIAQLKDLLDEYGVISKLKITYLPYGRQDKGINNGATFALHTFATLLNSLDFHDIEIVDPHSSIALEFIKNSHATYPIGEVYRIIEEFKIDLLCYPDKGAVSKYTKIFQYHDHIYGEKVRDQLTGHITNYNLIGNPSQKSVLIVDDICDYGRTFILLTKDLLAAGAKEVNLFVSHGLFSGGTKVLKDAGISRIFTKEGEALGDRLRSPM